MASLPSRISEEQVRVFATFSRNTGRWFTVADLGDSAGVSRAAAKKHVRTLHTVGLLDVNHSMMSSMYRWASSTPSGDGAAYLERLEQARKGYAALHDQERQDEARSAV